MKKTARSTLLMISISILLASVFTKPAMAATIVHKTANHDAQQLKQATNASCANPTPRMVSKCRAMERAVLASTVRILMFTPLMYVKGFGYKIINGMGHATIMNGRYLVTHNHYDETLTTILGQGDPDHLITMNIFNANGDLISQIPGRDLAVLVGDKETLVFDLGKGFFTALGLPSAKYISQPSVSIKPGMEVAQIDWDGTSSHVDWVKIDEITTREKTPIVRMSNCVMKGASGGGVFWQGQHIGNNWSRTTTCNQGTASGNAPYSSVALNSQLVIAP